SARESSVESCLRSCFAVDCLATVFPHNNCTKQQMQPAEADCHEPVYPDRRAEEREGAQNHKKQTHRGYCSDREHATSNHARAVKQEPTAGNCVAQSGSKKNNGEQPARDQRRRQTKHCFPTRS